MFPLKQNRKALFWLSHLLTGCSIPQHLRKPSPCVPGPLCWRPVPSPCRTRWCSCTGPRVRGHAAAQKHVLPHVLQSWQCSAWCHMSASFRSHLQPPKRAASVRFYSCIQPQWGKKPDSSAARRTHAATPSNTNQNRLSPDHSSLRRVRGDTRVYKL